MKSLLVLVVLIMIVCKDGDSADPECSGIKVFIRRYTEILKQLPYWTYPVFSVCTNETAETHYQFALSAYHNATNAAACQKYIAPNRMNIYEKIYEHLTDLWYTANCDACKSAPNTTAEFMNLWNKLQNCLQASNTDPCVICNDDYQHVQEFYAVIDKAHHGSNKLCFDIEDRMNQTRRAWSGHYNCCKDKNHSTAAFFSIVSVACVTPVVFYIVMYAITARREARHLTLLNATSGDQASHLDTTRIVEAENDHRIETDDDGNEENGESQPTLIESLNNLNQNEVDLSSLLQPDCSTSNMPTLRNFSLRDSSDEILLQ